MKKFFSEFKTFISKGNVIDLAVGVIIGSAFTAIVTALTTHILQPLINWLIYLISGSNGGIDGIYTFLVGSSENLDSAIYINWGALISSIINFFLVAIVLFIIVRIINRIRENSAELVGNIKKEIPTKEDRKEMKKLGIKRSDRDAVKKFMNEKQARLKAEEEAKKLEEEKKAEEERKNNPTDNDLLKDIKALLEKLQTKE